jgi:hypothetical protein
VAFSSSRVYRQPGISGRASSAGRVLLWLDLGVLNKKDHVIGPKESFVQAAFYISGACAFGG